MARILPKIIFHGCPYLVELYRYKKLFLINLEFTDLNLMVSSVYGESLI